MSTVQRFKIPILSLALVAILGACEVVPMLTPEEIGRYDGAISRVAGLEIELQGFAATLVGLNDSLSGVRAELASGDGDTADLLVKTNAIVGQIMQAQEHVRGVEAAIANEVTTITDLETEAAKRHAEELSPWIAFLPPPLQGPAQVGLNWLATALGASVLFKRSRQNLIKNLRERGPAGIVSGFASAVGWEHSNEDPAALASVVAAKAQATGLRIASTVGGSVALIPTGVPFLDKTAPGAVWQFENAAGAIMATATADQANVRAPQGVTRVVFGAIAA